LVYPALRPAPAVLRKKLLVFGVLSLLIVTSAFAAAHYFGPAPIDAEGTILGDADVVALQPDLWTGQRLPVLKHIDIGGQLGNGDWILVFYRANCQMCKQAIPRYTTLAYELANRPGAPKVALVEVPTDDDSSWPVRPGKVCARARLSAKKRWAGTVPWFLGTKDGVVTIATRSPEVLLNNPWGGMRSDDQFAGQFLDQIGDEATFPAYRQARRDMFLQEIACGPLSLIAVLQDLAVPLTSDDIEGLLAVAGTHGTDLLQLKDLAEKYGVNTLGVMVTTDKLRQLGQRAIVHLDRVGFAAVTGYFPDGMKVVYPLKPPGIVPDDLFAKSFGQNGYALLLSRRALLPQALGVAPAPAPRIEGPVLELRKNSLSVGRINSYGWEGFLSYRNSGTEPLEISGVDSSCACMTGTVDKIRLLPGETGTLHAVGEQRSIGKFRYSFTMKTNQGDPKEVKIPVQGYVEYPVAFDKPGWVVSGLLSNRPTALEVPLDLSPGIDPESLDVQTSPNGPLAAFIVRPLGQAPGLRVQWKGDDKIGWQRFQIDVK
jgi:hypothetical protein